MTRIKVRIAVVVDERGNWHACGDANWSDNESQKYVMESAGIELTSKLYFVEAEVDVPEPQRTQVVRGRALR